MAGCVQQDATFARISRLLVWLGKPGFIREQELSSEFNSQQYRGKRQSVVSDVKEAYYAVPQTESAMDVTAN